jgi:COMPASS component BRE2
MRSSAGVSVQDGMLAGGVLGSEEIKELVQDDE